VANDLVALRTSWRLGTRQEPQWRHITLQLGCYSRLHRIGLAGLVCPIGNVLKLHQRFFLPGKRLRAPQIHSRIQKLQPGLPFVLRSWFSDPYHVALRNIQWVIVWDDFDYLSAFQSESPHESEPLWRAIEYEAGSLFGIRSRLTTRLAPFFRTMRFDWRFL